jgi:hypothetical protein
MPNDKAPMSNECESLNIKFETCLLDSYMLKSEPSLLTFKRQKVVMLNSVQHLVLSKRLDPEIEDPDPETSSG